MKPKLFLAFAARKFRLAFVTLASLTLSMAGFGTTCAGQTVYATVSAITGSTSVFGTVNLVTGQFTQIASTNQTFIGLTTGPGNTIDGSATDRHLYSITPSGSTAQFGTATTPASFAPGFYGLANSPAGNFFGAQFSASGLDLYSVNAAGTSVTPVGHMATSPFQVSSGTLAFGPSGTLYYDYQVSAANSALFAVNTISGALTQIGAGFGAPLGLALVFDGTTLFGIDYHAGNGIYTINTTTGMATLTGAVSGMPAGYFLDTVTTGPTLAAVPESGSGVVLLALSLMALAGAARRFKLASA